MYIKELRSNKKKIKGLQFLQICPWQNMETRIDTKGSLKKEVRKKQNRKSLRSEILTTPEKTLTKKRNKVRESWFNEEGV